MLMLTRGQALATEDRLPPSGDSPRCGGRGSATGQSRMDTSLRVSEASARAKPKACTGKCAEG
eukprot:scaffold94086_cov33-Tisochrysis_lutea.AAC.3